MTKRTRRTKGEGTIYKTKNGCRGRLPNAITDSKTGERKDKYFSGKTKTEVRGKMDAWLMKHRKGKVINSDFDETTVTGFLNFWLESHIKPNRAKKTHQGYELTVRRYIVPFLGPMKLDSLTPLIVAKYVSDMFEKGFSVKMRKRGLDRLRQALDYAISLHVIPDNPCAASKIPTPESREAVPLTVEQCQTLFEHCDEHRIGDMISLSAMTGLRAGELLALRWSAVNLPEKILSVRESIEEVKGSFGTKPPKSKAGRRSVPLGDYAVASLQNRLRKAKLEGFGPGETEDDWVFPNNVGKLHRPSNYTKRVWHPIRDAAGIPASTWFHDLRHTQASLMIAAGVHIKVIQERLGHVDGDLVWKVYGHLYQGAQAKAVEQVDSLMNQSFSERR